MEDISMYVCTHKKFEKKCDFFKPVLCGAFDKDNDFGYIKDDTGDNISELNPFYSELTGLYWIWKNSSSKIIGLCHYRRNFIKHVLGGYLSKKDIFNFLDDYDIVVAKKLKFSYSTYEQYSKHHVEADIDLVKKSVEKLYPSYIPSFNKFFNSNGLYPYNMFIAKKGLMDKYCEWLFSIFDDFKLNINLDTYENDYQRRVFAFLSERLFNIWIIHNHLKVKECYVKKEEAKSSVVSIIDDNYLNSILYDTLEKF